MKKAEHPLDEADQLCADLKIQIARARDLVREARAKIDSQSKSTPT